MKALWSYETSVYFYRAQRHYISENIVTAVERQTQHPEHEYIRIFFFIGMRE
jgi:hypothetical protein